MERLRRLQGLGELRGDWGRVRERGNLGGLGGWKRKVREIFEKGGFHWYIFAVVVKYVPTEIT